MEWLVTLRGFLASVLWPASLVRQAADEGPPAAAEKGTDQPAPRSRARLGTVLRWTLHLLLLAAVLVGLWYLNHLLALERLLRSDWPALHPFWLPILFLLLYGLGWLGWWLWRLAGPETVGWDFPDVTSAWEEACGALAEAGIGVRDVPLFLVLGRPEGAESGLFEGAGLGLRVHQTPRNADAPLHVYASAEAVFVTCAGASVLGHYLALRADDRARAEELARRERGAGGKAPQAAGVVGKSAGRQGESDADLPEAAAAAVATETAGRSLELLPAEDQRILGLLEGEDAAVPVSRHAQAHRFLKTRAAVQLPTERLHHLCRLIAQARRPFCPVNGVLALLPFAVTGGEQEASEAATACRLDLLLLRRAVQVQCPGFALVCDMEASDGFREVVRRLPAQRVHRLGQRFPLLPDLEETRIPAAVDQSLAWLCDAMLPSLAYNLFRPGPGESLERDGRLYRFLAEMRDRRRRLSRLLTRAFLLDHATPWLFGGVYFAATEQHGGPSFVGGVLGRLVEAQNYVSWLPQALHADARYRRWAWAGWLGILALVVGVPIAAYFLWRW